MKKNRKHTTVLTILLDATATVASFAFSVFPIRFLGPDSKWNVFLPCTDD